jgi:N-acetylglucosamine-6-phosphate deacetylase
VRNLVAWGIATPQDAVAMASTIPARLLESRGVALPATELTWSDDLLVRHVRLADHERTFPPKIGA